MTREDPQLKLRLPSKLKEQIIEEARLSGRSVNAEIVHRLSISVEGYEGGSEKKRADSKLIDASFKKELRALIYETAAKAFRSKGT